MKRQHLLKLKSLHRKKSKETKQPFFCRHISGRDQRVMTGRHEKQRFFMALFLLGTSINLLRTMITSLIGAQNPHVLCVHSGISGSDRLIALATIYRGALFSQVCTGQLVAITTYLF